MPVRRGPSPTRRQLESSHGWWRVGAGRTRTNRVAAPNTSGVLQFAALFLQVKQPSALLQELSPRASERPPLAAGRAGGEFSQFADLRPDSFFHTPQMADLTRQAVDLPGARASLLLAHATDADRGSRKAASRFFSHFSSFLGDFFSFFRFLGRLFSLFGFDRGRACGFVSARRRLCLRGGGTCTQCQQRAK